MRIVIDLTMLRHLNCGLGQISRNIGLYLQSHPELIGDDKEIILYVPKFWLGMFGPNVTYLEAKDMYRFFPQLIPHWKTFDVWYSIHQLSSFPPPKGIKKRVLTIHDLNFIHEKEGRKQAQFLQRLQREVNQATEVCFISQFAQAEAQKYLALPHPSHQHVIYNGVEDTTLGETQPINELKDVPFLLSIGVVKAKKNLHTLVPMMKHLSNYFLVIAGEDDDPYAAQLRQLVTQNNINNIKIIGAVSQEERRWLYQHCKGLLFPSLCEGFGLPVIELMQWGKPVICSMATSLPEIGANHAYYFKDFNPENMAMVVRQSLQDFDHTHAIEEQQYAATFSYQKNLEAYFNLFSSL